MSVLLKSRVANNPKAANPTSYQKQGRATLITELVLSMQRPYCHKQIGRIGKVKWETGKHVFFDG
jgi:hypothetical protein